ncbi:MAG: DinB family protein [Chitinophagaceae bacterium]|jgi:uncharacterized damage-inducible protein DinB|nr:DinB family protein [Chitinophagaceae bacterium]
MSLKASLLAELTFEAGNTRKLLQAMTDEVLDYAPAHKAWTMAQLASHIVESYYWYVATFDTNDFDMATYRYDKGDTSKAANILAKFEENLPLAVAALESAADDSVFMENWTMRMGEQVFMQMPRIQAVRGFLMNHLYHHRGQLSIYLRAAGCKVPGIYGPSQDEQGNG